LEQWFNLHIVWYIMKILLVLFAVCNLYAQTNLGGSVSIAASQTLGLILAVPPNATGASYTLDTASNFCAAFNKRGGNTSPILIVIVNKGMGSITIIGGNGVTINGTATVAIGASRLFMSYGTCGATPSWTLQSIGGISSL
jgi:hypothetical protein